MIGFLKSHKIFCSRLLCLVLITGALGVYQSHARIWAAEVEENEKKIAEVEAWNREVLASENGTADFEDGSYEGAGIGFGGEIRVEVVVEDGEITEISLLEAKECGCGYGFRSNLLFHWNPGCGKRCTGTGGGINDQPLESNDAEKTSKAYIPGYKDKHPDCLFPAGTVSVH